MKGGATVSSLVAMDCINFIDVHDVTLLIPNLYLL